MNCLIDLHYLPCVAYFSCLSKFQSIVIEKHEHYEKQTYRNRCHINTANGLEKLIVPITAKHGKILITDVRIDYTQKWLTNHWRAIESAYRKAPFFEHYQDDLHKTLFEKPVFLYDLNFELLTMCLNWLHISVNLTESTSYEKVPNSGAEDLRNKISAKKTDRDVSYYVESPYQQVFGKTFVSNLSLIDLIFCEGPNAMKWVSA